MRLAITNPLIAPKIILPNLSIKYNNFISSFPNILLFKNKDKIENNTQSVAKDIADDDILLAYSPKKPTKNLSTNRARDSKKVNVKIIQMNTLHKEINSKIRPLFIPRITQKPIIVIIITYKYIVPAFSKSYFKA